MGSQRVGHDWSYLAQHSRALYVQVNLVYKKTSLPNLICLRLVSLASAYDILLST